MYLAALNFNTSRYLFLAHMLWSQFLKTIFLISLSGNSSTIAINNSSFSKFFPFFFFKKKVVFNFYYIHLVIMQYQCFLSLIYCHVLFCQSHHQLLDAWRDILYFHFFNITLHMKEILQLNGIVFLTMKYEKKKKILKRFIMVQHMIITGFLIKQFTIWIFLKAMA